MNERVNGWAGIRILPRTLGPFGVLIETDGISIGNVFRIVDIKIDFFFSEKKLVTFLRMILKTEQLIENYYHPWSYTKQTGN